MVAEVLDSIDGTACSEIFFVTQGRSNNKNVPLAEDRIKSKEIAIRVRNFFAILEKSGKDFGRIVTSNWITLATRVRFDIMKAITKNLNQTIFVFGYACRPVLHIKPKTPIKDQCGYLYWML